VVGGELTHRALPRVVGYVPIGLRRCERHGVIDHAIVRETKVLSTSAGPALVRTGRRLISTGCGAPLVAQRRLPSARCSMHLLALVYFDIRCVRAVAAAIGMSTSPAVLVARELRAEGQVTSGH
jgi:hypothetical protein